MRTAAWPRTCPSRRHRGRSPGGPSWARIFLSICQPRPYSAQARRLLNSFVSTRRRTSSRTPCRIALRCLPARLEKIGTKAPIFSTRRGAHMCAAKLDRRDTFPAPPFRPPSTSGSVFSRFPGPPTRRDLAGDAAQCASNSDPGLVKDILVLCHDPDEVCAKHHRRDLEYQLLQVGVGLKLAIVARLTQRTINCSTHSP